MSDAREQDPGADRHKTDLVYALAEYKQLVIAYKTKYAELVKAAVFWKTSCFWLGLLLACGVVLLALGQNDRRYFPAAAPQDVSREAEVRALARKLNETEGQLQSARREIARQEAAIRELEKNISTASRQMVEDLLQPD